MDDHASRQGEVAPDLATDSGPLSASLNHLFQTRSALIEHIVGQLVHAAVTDEDSAVRVAILRELNRAPALTPSLAQPEALRCLFIALNDECIDVRSLAVSMAGRLSQVNPAYCLPVLRRYLMVTLSDVRNSPDVASQAQSATLLGVLVRSAPALSASYIRAVATTLATQLAAALRAVQEHASPPEAHLLMQLLVTVGWLAEVVNKALAPFAWELINVTIEASRWAVRGRWHGSCGLAAQTRWQPRCIYALFLYGNAVHGALRWVS